jgi:hypothetical protein
MAAYVIVDLGWSSRAADQRLVLHKPEAATAARFAVGAFDIINSTPDTQQTLTTATLNLIPFSHTF